MMSDIQKHGDRLYIKANPSENIPNHDEYFIDMGLELIASEKKLIDDKNLDIEYWSDKNGILTLRLNNKNGEK